MIDLKNQIENKRKEIGLTQLQFAEKIDINVATYQNLLKSGDFRLSHIKKMSEILNVPISGFFNPSSFFQIGMAEGKYKSNQQITEIKETVELLKEINRHQKVKINNLYSSVKCLVSELLLHSNELKNINTYNNLYYFLKLYKDDLDNETIKGIESLTKKIELKLRNNKV